MNSVRKVVLGFVLASGLFSIVPVQAAIIYVDKDNACPGSGTSVSPYCSIQNAVNAVTAGDTIRIRDAASPYSETIQTSKSGLSGSPITVEPDIGHNPILRNVGAGSACATFWLHGSYWTIQNLNFDATGVNPCLWGAILVHADVLSNQSIKILGNTFKGWGGPIGEPAATAMNAVNVSGGANPPDQGNWPTGTMIEGNIFDRNRLISLSLAHTNGTIVRNNEFKGATCGRDSDAVNQLGIKLIYHNKNILITENSFHDFDPWSNCTHLSNQQYATEAAIWCDVDSNQGGNEISRNVVYNIDQNKTNQSNPNGLNHTSHGMFIEAGCGNYTVKNNVVYNIGNFGITNSYHSLGSAASTNYYYNNTIYRVGITGFLIKEGYVAFENNIVSKSGSNQICYGCDSGNSSYVSLAADYNLYDDGGSQTKIGAKGSTYNLTNWRSQCNCDWHALTGDPFFVNAGTGDFHLQASSPARGAGKNGVDIGALPFVSSSVLIAPSNLSVKY